MFIVTELIHGCRLEKLLPSRDRPLDVPILQAVLAQAFAGFAHLHASNIVHRDVHMGNILVSYKASSQAIDVGPGSVKIIDFGVAKQQRDRTVQPQTRMQCTLRYFSPERLAKDCKYNEKDDVWAMGVIITELLTGQLVSNLLHDGNLLGTEDPAWKEELSKIACAAEKVDAKVGGVAADILRARDPDGRLSAAQIEHRLKTH